MLSLLVLTFGMMTGPQTCALDSRIGNGYVTIAVVVVDKVDKRQSTDSYESGVVTMHALEILRKSQAKASPRFVPPPSSLQNGPVTISYRRIFRRAIIAKQFPSPWDAVSPKEGQTLLIELAPVNDVIVASVQPVTYPDDPAISVIKAAVGLESANNGELLRHLNDRCWFMRYAAAYQLNSRESCKVGSNCREIMLGEELAVLRPGQGAVDSATGWDQRVIALQTITNFIYGFTYNPNKAEQAFNGRIIQAILPYLDDDDAEVRGKAASFMSGVLSGPGTRKDMKQLLSGASHISLGKLRADIQNRNSHYEGPAKTVVEELEKLGVK